MSSDENKSEVNEVGKFNVFFLKTNAESSEEISFVTVSIVLNLLVNF